MPKGNYQAKGGAKIEDVAFRRHKCEICGSVYICEECSDALVRACFGRENALALYSKNHAPNKGIMLEPSIPWHCEACV